MMNFEHIAIAVENNNEIVNFYQDILGMERVRDFILDKNMAQKIFGIKNHIPVFLMKKGKLVFEIFINKQTPNLVVNHICFSLDNRNVLIKNAQAKGYQTIIIEREQLDLVFIKDKSGNIFEIKEHEV